MMPEVRLRATMKSVAGSLCGRTSQMAHNLLKAAIGPLLWAELHEAPLAAQLTLERPQQQRQRPVLRLLLTTRAPANLNEPGQGNEALITPPRPASTGLAREQLVCRGGHGRRVIVTAGCCDLLHRCGDRLWGHHQMNVTRLFKAIPENMHCFGLPAGRRAQLQGHHLSRDPPGDPPGRLESTRRPPSQSPVHQ